MKRTDLVAVPAYWLLAELILAQAAFGHSGEGPVAQGMLDGFLHPITGFDHVAAMVAVGVWGAVLGTPAIWLLPIAFPVAMALGGALGIAGWSLPYAEAAIASSGLVLGSLVAFYRKTPLAIAAVTVGVFAISHGYAHGAEAPSTADPVAYCVGFVFGTGLMHLCGIAVGMLDGSAKGRLVIRGVGGFIAAVGAYFLFA